MDRKERQNLRSGSKDFGELIKWAEKVRSYRDTVVFQGHGSLEYLTARIRSHGSPTSPQWRSLLLSPGDADHGTAMARWHALPDLSAEAQQTLATLTSPETKQAVNQAKAVYGGARMFAGKARKEAAGQAAQRLAELSATLQSDGYLEEIRAIASWDASTVAPLDQTAIFGAELGLAEVIGGETRLIDRRDAESIVEAIGAISRAAGRELEFRNAVASAATATRQAEARKLVSEMPIERLKDATNGQLRLGALQGAGIRNVQQVIDRGSQILYLPGIGQTTGTRMVAAARTILQTTIDEMPVRIDIKNRSGATADLLRAMQTWEGSRTVASGSPARVAAERIQPAFTGMDRATSHIALIEGASSFTEFDAAVDIVKKQASLFTSTGPQAADPWEDFLARPADYYAMLSELGLLTDDEDASLGDLPDEILEAIRDMRLETQHLKASLRGYQSFGARFAIVQKKVIIGDEMGLGKTVESLAVLTHLRAKGSTHFLVVCPAAVVTNWVREVAGKSDLRPHRLHGFGRDSALTSWIRTGGVAVTTYDTLAWLEGQIPPRVTVECAVFDEAHYIKNPDALRTRRSRALIRHSERAILLTGTPLENRIEEFRNLVGYLRPDLTVSASEFAPRQFRKQVAPAYLRRNQEDVLTELPELVEVDEWMPMSPEDADRYRSAVLDSNFMAMRQAALQSGAKSQKMQRLLDIVEEAEENERRVLVFSHFRGILDDVAASLPGKVFGPLTGSVPANKRQEMVDEFSKAPHGAVLVAQIVAGGVGLNIQSASVVVICEPQLKPTTEWQAIARARRMGQLESVQVHRLLSEESVDQRIMDILARKKELFADFARVSETAVSAPEAYDITDAEVARAIVAAERERVLALEPGR
ncbi:hypothetical protein Back2_14860 [Nocardioides baekrokdamisoli]|uniref:Helicase SNF2 n=1 Tax=Nocardioides baekrokdamisoli TaxID=1804624 RepID=A0A3G9J2H4_9ACTN|nr:DEAD/DEAH box helicase [Nocardioides baekrokdamisoli]BBH17199.1 hypothetical protein Back2_14860 [Nocardioides baekrokdamisoli]